MDVNFTNSSGTQMPLANIVESNFDDYKGFIRFDNGIQIVYASEILLGAEQSKDDDSLIIRNAVYKKPFLLSPTLTHGSLFAKINYNKKQGVGLIPKSVKYDNVRLACTSYTLDDKEITDKEGFVAEVQSTAEIASNIISIGSYFVINYIAIGRWK